MFLKTKPKTLSAAEAALGNFTKIRAAIDSRVMALEPLIKQRLGAEAAVEEAEAQVALGEKENTVAARKGLDQALQALAHEATVLKGLRTKMFGMADQLITSRQQLEADLPEHKEAVEAKFKQRWDAGVRAFSELLGERAALETLLGGGLALRGAHPADVTLEPEVTAPTSALKALARAITELARASEMARNSGPMVIPGRSQNVFDPGSVYVLRRGAPPLAAGSLVVEASLDPGLLRHLVGLDNALPYKQQVSWAAEQESRRIVQDAAEKAEQRRLVEEKAMQDAMPHNRVVPATPYPDLSEVQRRDRLSGRHDARLREAAEELDRNSPNPEFMARNEHIARLQADLERMRSEDE